MLYFVLHHGNERNITPELANSLREAVKHGCKLILSQDSRFEPFEEYKEFPFEHIVDDTPAAPDFAAFQNAVLKVIPEGEWILWVDFDEYLCNNFFEKVKPYLDSKRAWVYQVTRINIIEPQERVDDLIKEYGWRYVMIDVPEYGKVKAINFPDYQTRLSVAGKGKWYGKVHDRIVVENGFKQKTLPFDGGYILHRKSYEKQITDNALWSTYTP